MKAILKSDFIIHNIAGEQVLIGIGEQVDFSKLLMLNDTAACIITMLQKQSTMLEELIQKLIDEYNTSPEEAQKDIEILLCELEQLGVITIEP